MIGEINHPDPTVDIPPWTYPDDQTADMHYYNTLSPNANANSCLNFTDDYALKAFQRYLPSNNNVTELDYEDFDVPMDMYTCDNFRIYEFKIRKCARGKSHDWTECPYAHPCEKARRRDPRKYHYSGTACPDFRKGNICKKGDGCEFAHGVFECWLHPSRYRTQPCKDGPHCKRKVCFFAHSPEQLRVLSPRTDSSSYDGSPRGGVQFGSVGYFSKSSYLTSSPDSGSPPTESPPMSPMTGSPLSRSLGSSSVNEILASLRQLQLNKVKSMPCSSWNNNIHIGCSSGLGSPRLPVTRSGFISLPSTPTQVVNRPGLCFDQWDKTVCEEEEPVMERVESGKGLRAKMFEKLSKENPLDGPDLNPNPYQFEDPNPDVDWVSDLIQ